jgi:hypothetical protein
VSSPPYANSGPVFPRDSIPLPTAKTRARAEGGTKEGHYRPLPKEFRRGGFDYRQIARDRNAAIYKQTWNGCRDPAVCFEVVRIKRRQGFEIKGKFIEPGEVYPNSEAWGADGFTVTDKEAAFHKWREIAASSNAPIRFGQKGKRSRLEKSPT